MVSAYVARRRITIQAEKQGMTEDPRIRDPLAGNIQGDAMVRTGPHHRQTRRIVHSRTKAEGLEGMRASIVVHGQDAIYFLIGPAAKKSIQAALA